MFILSRPGLVAFGEVELSVSASRFTTILHENIVVPNRTILEVFYKWETPTHRFQWLFVDQRPSSYWGNPPLQEAKKMSRVGANPTHPSLNGAGSHKGKAPCGCSACQSTTPLLLVATHLPTPLAGVGVWKLLWFKQHMETSNSFVGGMEFQFASFISQHCAVLALSLEISICPTLHDWPQYLVKIRVAGADHGNSQDMKGSMVV